MSRIFIPMALILAAFFAPNFSNSAPINPDVQFHSQQDADQEKQKKEFWDKFRRAVTPDKSKNENHERQNPQRT